jgi:hypothetical protein
MYEERNLDFSACYFLLHFFTTQQTDTGRVNRLRAARARANLVPCLRSFVLNQGGVTSFLKDFLFRRLFYFVTEPTHFVYAMGMPQKRKT